MWSQHATIHQKSTPKIQTHTPIKPNMHHIDIICHNLEQKSNTAYLKILRPTQWKSKKLTTTNCWHIPLLQQIRRPTHTNHTKCNCKWSSPHHNTNQPLRHSHALWRVQPLRTRRRTLLWSRPPKPLALLHARPTYAASKSCIIAVGTGRAADFPYPPLVSFEAVPTTLSLGS